MSTAWTLAAADICTDALEHLGAIAAGETIGAEDMQVALRALDAVLKELPLAGYTWPKLSAEVALPWGGGQSVTLPSDYFGSPVAWRLVDGKKVPLTQIAHAQWLQMPDRDSATGAPTHFYVGPDKVACLWPVPETEPAITLQYQRVVTDASRIVQPDVPQYMLNALGYGVANELALKFGASMALAEAIATRWQTKRAAALEYSIESAPICFEVRD